MGSKGALYPENVGESAEQVLTVEGLSFGYGSDDVVSDASVTFGAGEVIGLLGSNGSGKSTFLGAVTDSIIGNRSGNVRMLGSLTLDRRQIGYATQEVGLYAVLTVSENLQHAARAAARSAEKCRGLRPGYRGIWLGPDFGLSGIQAFGRATAPCPLGDGNGSPAAAEAA